jgi:hypothetical protein
MFQPFFSNGVLSNRVFSKPVTTRSFFTKRTVFLLALLTTGGGMSIAAAQNTPESPAPTNQPAANEKGPPVDHRLIKPGDRSCLRQTGSLIPPKKGECLPVAGRSYSGDELRNTGAIDNAHALQMLDPSISLGH